MLNALALRIRQIDPDIPSGWNVIDFDLAVLQRRFDALRIPFNIGRTQDASQFRESDVWGKSRMVVYGRQVLDALMRKSLDSVASVHDHRGKGAPLDSTGRRCYQVVTL